MATPATATAAGKKAGRKKAAANEEAAPPPPAMPGTQMSPEEQEFATYLQGLLDGKSKPETESIGYLVKKIAEGRGQHEALLRNIQFGESQLTQAKAELVRLEGRIDENIQSLRHFRRDKAKN